MSDFPTRLKKLRSDSKLTQTQLAEKLNVSQNAVYNWENGKREPNLDMMKKIAKAFDIALYLLLDDTYLLPDITSDAWKNRARFSGDTEMEKRPLSFTAPANTNGNRTITIDTAIDESHPFHIVQKKVENGEKLTKEETALYNLYIKRALEAMKQSLEKFGETLKKSYSQYYALLNEEGVKEADKQIDKAIERAAQQAQEQSEQQIKLLTKVPEYQKKQDD